MKPTRESEAGKALRSMSLDDLDFIAKVARTPFQEWVVRHSACVSVFDRQDPLMLWRDEQGYIQAWCKVCGNASELGTGATGADAMSLVTIAVGMLTEHPDVFTADFRPAAAFDECLHRIEQAILFCRLLEQAARSEVAH